MCVAAIERSNLCMTAVFNVGNGHNLKTAFILVRRPPAYLK